MKSFMYQVMVIVLAIITIAVLGGVNGQGSCNNPMFNSTGCVGTYCFIQRSVAEPESKPDTNICPDLAVGSPSCCSASTYDYMKTNFAVYNSYSAVQVSTQLNAGLNSSVDAIVNAVSTHLDGLTDSQKSAVIDAYKSYVVILFSSFNYTQLFSCVQAQLYYQSGIACLSCRPDFAKYVTYNSTLNEIIFTLDQNTCTSLQQGCSAYYANAINNIPRQYAAIVNLYFALNNANVSTSVYAVFGISPSLGYGFYQNLLNETSQIFNTLCPNGNCDTHICQTFAAGLYINTPSAATTTKQRGLPHQALLNLARTSVDRIVENAKRQLAPTTYPYPSSYYPSPVPYTGITVSVNVYTSNGYPASTNGQNSNLNNKLATNDGTTTGGTNTSPASSISTWLSILL